jgi:hypothetical protein
VAFLWSRLESPGCAAVEGIANATAAFLAGFGSGGVTDSMPFVARTAASSLSPTASSDASPAGEVSGSEIVRSSGPFWPLPNPSEIMS